MSQPLNRQGTEKLLAALEIPTIEKIAESIDGSDLVSAQGEYAALQDEIASLIHERDNVLPQKMADSWTNNVERDELAGEHSNLTSRIRGAEVRSQALAKRINDCERYLELREYAALQEREALLAEAVEARKSRHEEMRLEMRTNESERQALGAVRSWGTARMQRIRAKHGAGDSNSEVAEFAALAAAQ